MRSRLAVIVTVAVISPCVWALPSNSPQPCALCAAGRNELGANVASLPTALRLLGGRGRSRTRDELPPAAAQRSSSWNWLTDGSKSSRLTKLQKVALAVSFYFATSLSLTFMNKIIFNRFEFPLFVTCYQQLITWILLWTFGTIGQHSDLLSFAPPPEFEWRIALEVLPLTVLYVGMLASTNYCLRHVDISFYQILRSLVIPLNIVTSYIFLASVPRLRTVGCCLIVMCGFVIGSLSELNFSRAGFTAGCLASSFMALYSTFVKKVLPCVNGSTWRLMSYTTILSLLFLVPMAALSGEMASARESLHFAQISFWFLMTQAGVLGFLINLAYFALIKHGSPLTTHIANCAKSAMQTGLGVLLFGNRITSVNILGILLTILGSSLYSMDRYYCQVESSSRLQLKGGRGEVEKEGGGGGGGGFREEGTLPARWQCGR